MVKISKRQLAAELGVSPSRISQLIAAGLPTLRGGRLSREAALRWVAEHSPGDGGGLLKRGRPEAGEVASKLVSIDEAGNTADEAAAFAAGYQAGTRFAFSATRDMLRRSLPHVLGPMRISLNRRAALLAIIDVSLMRADPGMPAPADVDWTTSFGTEAEKAKAIFEECCQIEDDGGGEAA